MILTDTERFNYLEGKIWALEALLSAVVKSSGLSDEQFEGAIEQARKSWPGLNWGSESGKGFDQTVQHMRNLRASELRRDV